VGVEGGLGPLDGVPEGVDDGAVVSQLAHVDLHNEYSGSVVLEDVQGGGEHCRSWHQSPQSRLPQ
jgi:hypothetical protein